MTPPLRLDTLISEADLAKRVFEMGKVLSKKMEGKDPIAICVLKGSFMFYADIIRQIEGDVTCEFFGVSSYNGSTKSSGEVKVTLDISLPIEGRDVILVEDIVDTGLTMHYLQSTLKARQPNSLTTITLLHKPDAKKIDCELDDIGFTIGNEFVVGYGLDYLGLYRNLPYIARVNDMN
jgi:hypoxanthine phosphoribosyltransferase